MRSIFLAFTLFAHPLGAQEAPPHPKDCVTCPKESSISTQTVRVIPNLKCNDCRNPFKEIPAQLGKGDWPVDTLYNIFVALMGEEKAKERIQKGFESMSRNIYRKYYIEQGYFLLPLHSPDEPGAKELDHMILIPKNPGDDPRVIFMKEAHKFGENAAGMANTIREALKNGDENLVYLAGQSLFNSKFTQKEYSVNVAESSFGKKPYYYKIDQRNFFSKWKVEGAALQVIQIGDKPYYVGGSLGAKAELDASFRYLTDISAVKRKLIPTAKLGFWGKVPGMERTSFGLSALQSYNLYGDEDGPDRFFSTEFRLGAYHASKAGATGSVMLHYTRNGEKIFSNDRGQSFGAQGTYSPASGWASFSGGLNMAEIDDGKGGKKWDPQPYLVFQPMPRKEIDIDALGRETAGYIPPPPPKEDEFQPIMDSKEWVEWKLKGSSILRRARFALQYVDSPARPKDKKPVTPKELRAFLREQLLAEVQHMTLTLSSCSAVGISPEGLLAGAASMEKWEMIFGKDPNRLADGWTVGDEEVKAKEGEQVAKEIFEAAKYQGTPEEAEKLQDVLITYASDLRRLVDYRAMQTLHVLKTLLETNSIGYAAGRGVESVDGSTIWNSFSHMNADRHKDLKHLFTETLTLFPEPFHQEGRRYQKQVRRYGEKILEEQLSCDCWPASVKVIVTKEVWVPLLSDYGEDFFKKLLNRLKKAGEKVKKGETLNVEIANLTNLEQSAPWRIPEGIRIHPRSPFQIQIAAPPGKKLAGTVERFFSQLDGYLPQ